MESKKEAIERVKWETTKKLLDDLTINNGDYSEDVFNRINKNYLGERCAFEQWEEYWEKRNKEEEKEQNAYSVFGIKGQVDHFYKMQPFFYDKVKTFHLWKEEEGRWEKCDKVDMLNKLQENIPHADTINSKQKNEIIAALEQVGRQRKPKDIPKTWIQFKNKIVDVLSGEEFYPSPEYYTTNPIPWNLGESEETPTIDKLLKEWVVDGKAQDESYIKTMKQIIAYIICSDQFLQRLVALCGAGLNGKGTFIKMVLKFLGADNSCSSDLKILATNNFEAASLYKKLLCVMGEVDASDLKNTNTIKKLSGEDGMRYEFKGKGSFTEDSPTTCLIATNSLPTTPDKSLGFYRRWLIIDFPHQFTIKRDLIGQIPDEEFENLGRCCLNLLKEMYEENKFENEGELSKRMDRYEERSNPIMRFIENDCEEDFGEKVELREFCNAFNNYLKSRHLRVISPIQIGKQLRNEGFEVSARRVNKGMETISAKFVIGLRLKTTRTTQTTEISSNIPPSKISSKSGSSGSSGSSDNQSSKFTDEELTKLGYSEKEIKDLLGDYRK